jgi:SAM-dependent methyltransferase
VGARWADLGTGTGAVALLAARGGAEVTALDITPAMIDQARANAQRDALEIQFDVGDAQALPYGDASFDVVTSCFGVVFAPRREDVAGELARVCRPGGRLGLTAWRPKPALKGIYERFQDAPPAAENTDWGAEGFAESLLGEAFDLRIEERVWHLEGESPEAVFDFMRVSAPPTAAFLARLDEERREGFHQACVEHWSQFVGEGGRVREPRAYILVTGTRR